MPDFRFSTAELSTGLRLHYAEHGDVDGEPILFLHGWPDSWFSSSRVAESLPVGYRAVLPDQRGFGESDRPASGYRIEDFAGDAVALLDALALDRATVIGHSFGSFVARCVAIAYPSRVSRLVLIGTGLSPSNAVTQEVRAAMLGLEDPVPQTFAREFQAGTAYASLPPAFFERIVLESMKLPAWLWRETFDRLLEYADDGQLGRITSPTLVVYGERDALFPRDDQDRVAAAIRGAELEIYEETGHCPNWERPEQVAADLHRFVRRG